MPFMMREVLAAKCECDMEEDASVMRKEWWEDDMCPPAAND